jgi:predicted RecA/RadA family phage recombinase
MTAEAIYKHDEDTINIVVPTGGYSSGQVILLADGRAGVVSSLNSVAAGDTVAVKVKGLHTVEKTASIVLLDGGEVRWDHSANTASFPAYVDSKDFYLGRAVGDSVAAATTVVVDLNADRNSAYITLQKSAFANARVYTAGFPRGGMQGGAYYAGFSATAEAQKEDLLSVQSFAVASNWIFEAVVNVLTAADADVVDLNVGVANATHASDADSIAESCLVHLDSSGSSNILAESDDGTTEVAATDTTVDWAAGTPFHVVFDGRDPADIQLYVNGVNRLPASVFVLTLATGPLKAFFHVEKSSNDSLFDVLLQKLEVRLTADVEA